MLSRSSRVLGARLLSRFSAGSSSSSSSAAASSFSTPSRLLTSSRSLRLDSRPLLLSAPSSARPLSSKASPEGEPKKDGGVDDAEAPKDQYGESGSVSTEVLTPGQKVVETYYKVMWGGAAVLAAACAYYIIRELIPTKM